MSQRNDFVFSNHISNVSMKQIVFGSSLFFIQFSILCFYFRCIFFLFFLQFYFFLFTFPFTLILITVFYNYSPFSLYIYRCSSCNCVALIVSVSAVVIIKLCAYVMRLWSNINTRTHQADLSEQCIDCYFWCLK